MAPTHVLIQLTDLHLLDEGEPARDGVDTLAVLERALAVVAAAPPPSALLFTGDLADSGSAGAYRRLRSAVQAAGIDAPVVYVAGNHDDRATMRTELLGSPASTEPLDHVTWLGDLRLVVLDSTVPGRGYGELRPEQLAWLRAELAEPAPAGTVLTLHHPPLPAPVRYMDRYALADRAALGAAIAGTDVRIVLSGHVHAQSAGLLAGVPVWTGGPIFTTIDGLAPRGVELRTFATPSMSRVDVYEDEVLVSAIPLAPPALTVRE